MVKHSLLIIVVLGLLHTNFAYGYIDPGPTNLIIQFIIAMIAGSAFYFRGLFAKAKAALKKNKKPSGSANGQGAEKNKKTPRKAA